MSSKIKVSTFQEVVPIKKDRSRDPRFDSLCGTYNERVNQLKFGHWTFKLYIYFLFDYLNSQLRFISNVNAY